MMTLGESLSVRLIYLVRRFISCISATESSQGGFTDEQENKIIIIRTLVTTETSETIKPLKQLATHIEDNIY